MKKATLSGIIGSIILCIMSVFFIHPTETVKLWVSIIAITIFSAEGIILFIYALIENE